MADIVPPGTRSRMMAGIRGKDTKPEWAVRRALFSRGYRFRLHRRDLPGKPDIAMPGRRVAVFVHGCFWHMHQGCRYSKMPATREEFWRLKLQGNAERDRRGVEAIKALGWRALTVWECATRGEAALEALPEKLSGWIEGSETEGEISGPRP